MATNATSVDQRSDEPTAWVHGAMTALSLVILVVCVLWQVRQGGDESGAPVAEGTMQSSAVTAAIRVVAPRVYIVGSPEGAEALRALFEQANEVRRFKGLPPLDEKVEWFDSAEDEANFWQGINVVVGVPEMTSLSVIDLRELSGAGSAQQDAASH